MTTFCDYPIPDHYPNYMHHSKIMEYLRMYARHFGLMKHIQFQVRRESPPTACTWVKAKSTHKARKALHPAFNPLPPLLGFAKICLSFLPTI